MVLAPFIHWLSCLRKHQRTIVFASHQHCFSFNLCPSLQHIVSSTSRSHTQSRKTSLNISGTGFIPEVSISASPASSRRTISLSSQSRNSDMAHLLQKVYLPCIVANPGGFFPEKSLRPIFFTALYTSIQPGYPLSLVFNIFSQ